MVTGELHQLQRQQAIRETDIDIALDVMRDVDKQWLLASPSSRVRFQSILFPRGLVYDYEQHRFGTSQISPLYRLVATKKDSEEPSKSFLVAGAGFGHILRPRNFTIENKFSSEGFLANCHHGSSHLRPGRSQLQPAS